MQMLMPDESRVAPGAIHGNPQQLGLVSLELRKHLVVKSHLISAYGAPVRRIEGKDYRLATQFAEREHLIRCNVESKIWSLGTSRKYFSHFSPNSLSEAHY